MQKIKKNKKNYPFKKWGKELDLLHPMLGLANFIIGGNNLFVANNL